MTEDLPIHPRTGLRAVGIVGGRAVWPILGADENGDEATFTRLAAIDTELEAVRSELLGFVERAENLNETEAARFDELEVTESALATERAPLAKRAEVIDRVREAQRSRTGLEGPRGPEYMVRVKPFENLEAVRAGQLTDSDLRSRALAAVEHVEDSYLADAQRTAVEQMLRTNDRKGRIARHLLMTGSDAYGRAFESFLGGRPAWSLPDAERAAFMYADELNRAMNEGSSGAGGALVPFFLDPTIILTNDGSTNPIRQAATVKTIATNEWNGVTSAGVTASYMAEAAEQTDDSPTVAPAGIPVNRASAYLQASFEVNQDTNFASEIGMLLADARDNLEAVKFAIGSGTGCPKGVVTAIAAVGGSVVTTAASGTYTLADLYSLKNAIKPRYRGKTSWLASDQIYTATRQFATGSGPSNAFWADLGVDTPPILLGKPALESSPMATTVAAGNVILLAGDLSQYYVVDRIGMSVQFEPLVKGDNGRPTGEVGWFAYWRNGGDCVNTSAIKALKVHA